MHIDIELNTDCRRPSIAAYSAERGSINKGLLLVVLVLAAAATITFYFIKPAREQPNQVEATAQSIIPPMETVVGIPTPDYSVVPESMLEIEYTFTHGTAKGRPIEPQQVRYYQAGDFYGRRELSPNYFLGQQEVILRNKQDQWIVNLFTKSARHMDFAGPTLTKALPMPTRGYAGILNFGEEIQFFVRNNAKQEIVGEEEIYTLSSQGENLTLVVSTKTKLPVRLEYSGDGIVTKLNISKYDTSKRFNEQLFAVPKDLQVLEIGSNQLPLRFRRWLDEDPRILGYYRSSNSEDILNIIKDLRWSPSLPGRSYLGNFFGLVMEKQPDLLREILKITKDKEPEVQLLIANGLRWCRNDECAKALKSNPFGFSDEGIHKFAEIPSRVRQAGVPVASPDGMLSEFLVTGDTKSLMELIDFFDKQLEVQGKYTFFVEHVKEYASVVKRLMKDNLALGNEVSQRASSSKMATFIINADDSIAELPKPGSPKAVIN